VGHRIHPCVLRGEGDQGRERGPRPSDGGNPGRVIAYSIVFLIVAYFVGSVIGPSADALALILGFVAWLAVFRASFRTSWLGAIGIVFVAWLILLVLDFIFVVIFSVPFPKFYPF